MLSTFSRPHIGKWLGENVAVRKTAHSDGTLVALFAWLDGGVSVRVCGGAVGVFGFADEYYGDY